MKERYLKKLHHTLRWYLDADEAEDIEADYQDILQQESDEAIALMQENPMRTAQKLSDSKKYCKWIFMFLLLSFCMMLEGFSAFFADKTIGLAVSVVMAIIGMIAAVVRFNKDAKRKKEVPFNERTAIRTLYGILAGIFLLEIAAVWFIYMQKMDMMTIISSQKCISLILSAIGILSVFYSRMRDIRWLCVYMICLSLIPLCCLILFTVYDMRAVAPYGIGQIKLFMIGAVFVLLISAFAIKMEMRR